jgi:hypothetical protein
LPAIFQTKNALNHAIKRMEMAWVLPEKQNQIAVVA